MKKGIRKVKTWYGLKYGIVNLNAKNVYNAKKELRYKAKEIDVVESENGPLLFPLTTEGLNKAKEILKTL